MRKYIFLLLILASAQSRAQLFDHLEPVDHTFLSYDANIFKQYSIELLKDFSQEYPPYVRFVVIPTADNYLTGREYAVEIAADSLCCALKYHSFTDSLRTISKIARFNKRISDESAQALLALFKNVLKDTRYNNEQDAFTTEDDFDYMFPVKIYYFFEGESMRSGRSNFPSKGKTIKEFIAICEALILYAKGSENTTDIGDSLKKRIDSLTARTK